MKWIQGIPGSGHVPLSPHDYKTMHSKDPCQIGILAAAHSHKPNHEIMGKSVWLTFANVVLKNVC